MEPNRPSWWFQIPDSTTAVRRRPEFRAYLEACGASREACDLAELIFGEIVGNAAVHAPGPIEVLVEWSSGEPVLHVSDEGPPVDIAGAARLPDPLAEHGRGLALVDALAPGGLRSRLFVPTGKTMSAALPIRLAAVG